MSAPAKVGSAYQSATTRLLALPAVFTGTDLALHSGWSPKQCAHYLWQWKRRAFILPLGGHSDVYANLVVNRAPNTQAMLVMAMPSAVRIGVDALRTHGWTTQIESRPSVAVRADGAVYATEHFTVHARPAQWYAATQRAYITSAHPLLELRCLKAAWALADMVKSGDHMLAPDDIEWDAVNPQDEADWASACPALNLPLLPLNEEGYAQFYDSANRP